VVKFSHSNLRFVLVRARAGGRAATLMPCDGLRMCVAVVWWERAEPRGAGMAQNAFAHARVHAQAVAQSPNPMELVVTSVCPGIFGHDLVKFGLTLALFGELSTSLAPHPSHNATHRCRYNIRIPVDQMLN
jgi:hypothetical protein